MEENLMHARENKSVFLKTKLKKRMHSYQKKKSQI